MSTEDSSSCLFCRIIAGNIPADLVYQDEHVVAFRDIDPQAPVHILIIPREHISGVDDIQEQHRELIGHIFMVASKLAAREKVGLSGYRVVVNSGRDAGQAVDHLHYHLLAGRKLSWPPG